MAIKIEFMGIERVTYSDVRYKAETDPIDGILTLSGDITERPEYEAIYIKGWKIPVNARMYKQLRWLFYYAANSRKEFVVVKIMIDSDGDFEFYMYEGNKVDWFIGRVLDGRENWHKPTFV